MNRHFFIGLAAGLLAVLAINLLAAHLSSDCGLPAVLGFDTCADDITRMGWPLQFMEQGGFAYRYDFNLVFFLIDSLIGVGTAALGGWMYARSKKDPPK